MSDSETQQKTGKICFPGLPPQEFEYPPKPKGFEEHPGLVFVITQLKAGWYDPSTRRFVGRK